ncbi:MAG TPA: hypothetical protein VK141_02080 [Nitrosomonas sp.]|nr:hypothetical protein [Nitrosomonas sp.]
MSQTDRFSPITSAESISFSTNLFAIAKDTLINSLHERIVLLHGTRSLAYRVDKSRLLRSERPSPHLVRRINQHSLIDGDVAASSISDENLSISSFSRISDFMACQN